MEELKELRSKLLDWMERYTELSLQVRKLIEMANDPEASDEDIVDWILNMDKPKPGVIFEFDDEETKGEFIAWYLDGGGDFDWYDFCEMHDIDSDKVELIR